MSKTTLGILQLNLTVFYSGYYRAFDATLDDNQSIGVLRDWARGTYLYELEFLKNNLINFP